MIFLLIIIFTLISFLYVGFCLSIGKNVSAGNVDTVNFRSQRLFFIPPHALLSYHGPDIPFKETCLGKVNGDSCRQRGIYSGDLILGRNFKEESEKKSLNKGDVLFIKFYHKRTKRDEIKIREFVRYLDGNKIQTRKTEGEELVESNPHDISGLIGKVDYVYKKNRWWIDLSSVDIVD